MDKLLTSFSSEHWRFAKCLVTFCSEVKSGDKSLSVIPGVSPAVGLVRVAWGGLNVVEVVHFINDRSVIPEMTASCFIVESDDSVDQQRASLGLIFWLLEFPSTFFWGRRRDLNEGVVAERRWLFFISWCWFSSAFRAGLRFTSSTI